MIDKSWICIKFEWHNVILIFTEGWTWDDIRYADESLTAKQMMGENK